MHPSKASEIMSKGLITSKHTTPLTQAHELMRAKNIRHLPITDDTGNIIGILSDRDLQRAMIPDSSQKNAKNIVTEMNFTFNPTHLVRDFMSFPIRVVELKTTLKDVAEMMIATKISSFLVTDGHRPRGIVTTEDLLKVLVELLKKEPSSLQRTLDGFVQIWDPVY